MIKHKEQHTMDSFEELDNVLSRETSKLIAGEITVSEAKAIVSIARTKIAGFRALLEYTKVTGKSPECNFLGIFHKSKDEDTNGKRKTAERLTN